MVYIVEFLAGGLCIDGVEECLVGVGGMSYRRIVPQLFFCPIDNLEHSQIFGTQLCISLMNYL